MSEDQSMFLSRARYNLRKAVQSGLRTSETNLALETLARLAAEEGEESPLSYEHRRWSVHLSFLRAA